MISLMEDDFTGRWDEFFSRIGNPQALPAGIISAGLTQSGAAPDPGAAESRVEEQGREVTENCQFPVPTSS
jgi:hypothetical protein